MRQIPNATDRLVNTVDRTENCSSCDGETENDFGQESTFVGNISTTPEPEQSQSNNRLDLTLDNLETSQFGECKSFSMIPSNFIKTRKTLTP